MTGFPISILEWQESNITPGVYFSISMLGCFVEADYDGRHWDQERDTWEREYYLEDRVSEDDCFNARMVIVRPNLLVSNSAGPDQSR